VAFSLQDLDEVRAANGDAYLSNLLRFLVLLDANNDTTDGFQIDATATNAIAAAVTWYKSAGFRGQRRRFRRGPHGHGACHGAQSLARGRR
jgi:hypothetical protein